MIWLFIGFAASCFVDRDGLFSLLSIYVFAKLKIFSGNF